ncbi:hypothetical protein TBR22_A02680 [Luteitalea sp. TBR-22]|uniref:helix-turn-helix transcriptional regulator n=1 Tax=Luteitalea sp. TBR-22 TaxID=2802971 RepID=UPI001AF5B8E1|nr:helix-turn-helix transcriptional regulator [Luteitalea sp. TBR-22]BCS31068.1 hypothetical protein TBR22_A02680 [Luteitalea sp. TBR-22]
MRALLQATGPGRVVAWQPCPLLSGCVDHYWLGIDSEPGSTTLLPDGRVDVVLELTGAATTVRVYGAVTARAEVPLQAGATYVGVQFRPGRSRHFLASSAVELTDRCVAGADALACSLERVHDQASPDRAIAALEQALAAHLHRNPPQPSRVDHVVATLEAGCGPWRIGDVARALEVSPRQLERQFLRDVGLPPKQFAMIRRFNEAAAHLRARRPAVVAATDAGYADQSDMCRAFQRYIGQTPAAYGRGDVTFLQDEKVWLDGPATCLPTDARSHTAARSSGPKVGTDAVTT